MSFLNYNSQEASNLSLAQGGFKSIGNTSDHPADAEGIKRWTGIIILDANGGLDIVLNSNIGDDLTIPSANVTDLVGTIISGDFYQVNSGAHHIMAFKG